MTATLPVRGRASSGADNRRHPYDDGVLRRGRRHAAVHAMKVPPGVGTGPGQPGQSSLRGDQALLFSTWETTACLRSSKSRRARNPDPTGDAIGGMQHCAFAVTPDQLERLRRRLDAAGRQYDGPVDILPGLVSIYFLDPNGIRLEACCQHAEGDNQQVIGSVLQTRAQAREELVSTGAPKTGSRG